LVSIPWLGSAVGGLVVAEVASVVAFDEGGFDVLVMPWLASYAAVDPIQARSWAAR
jgi:hypothetical protein